MNRRRKTVEPPKWRDPMLDVLVARGEAHEAAYDHSCTFGFAIAMAPALELRLRALRI